MAKINIEYIVLWRCLHGIASQEELQELELWLVADESHRLLYQHLERNKEADIEVSEERILRQWERLQTRLEPKSTIKLKRLFQYAAAIILPLAIGLSVLLFTNTDTEITKQAHVIQPGSTKAHLQLADGSFVSLDAESKQFIKNTKGEIIGSDSLDVLVYDNLEEASEVEYNTIVVPRGGEYNLILADGTRVWLNAETKLSYPVAFVGGERKVKLVGEALFDVTRDETRAFIVTTNNSAIKVYGTQFNVMSYEDEKVEQTTLVEGSIAVLYNNEEVMVQPGQQAILTQGQVDLQIKEVDTDLYTAWKDGIFRFENMPLEEVANKLSRWYDVDFFFSNNEVKGRKISGAMKRETDFKLFMGLIEKSAESEITINDNTVLVKAKY
ncbi:FecR family protein [Carboxylicivirga sp. N1Y90]|uniref:FecR family protein n=1 Tax=Carboxylicivirga fragile TaxID=3417571 RepID=UPI003D341760|nr:FecR domain-containing protein [Marinilabiliaceae bacterium N1Y90]